MKRLIVVFNIILVCIAICGCGLYEKEYVSIEEYKFPTNATLSQDGHLTVTNKENLREAVLNIVYSGSEIGIIDFSENYNGNPDEDLRNTCWQVKSRDALCVYCVNNISYKLTKLVSYYQAIIEVIYEKSAIPLDNIYRLQYSTGIEDILSTSIYTMDKKIGLLINKSLYSINDIENLIQDTYFENPLISPIYPKSSINLFSGSDLQRLYEISFDYGVSDDELVSRKQELADISLFPEDVLTLDDKNKLKLIIEKLSKVEPIQGASNIYDSLVLNKADDLGIALGFKALCNVLDIESYVVKGMKLGSEYYWNIVKIDNNYYHVVMEDPSLWFVNDETIWSNYRWNTSNYPSCHSSMEEPIIPDESAIEAADNVVSVP